MMFDNERGVGGKIKLHWFDGGRKAKAIKDVPPEFMADARNDNCLFIVGTKNVVTGTHYGTETRLFSRDKMIEAKKEGLFPPEKYPRNKTKGNPQQDWISACINNTTPESNFDYASPFNELVMLGMVSVLLPERDLSYNPDTMSFKGCPEADKFTRSLYAYRSEFLPKKY